MANENDEKRAYEDYYNKQFFDSLKQNHGYDESKDKLSAKERDELQAYETEQHRQMMNQINPDYPYR